MRPWVTKAGRRAFVLLMLVGSALITAASLAYFDPETLPPFVIEKLPFVRFEALWLASLKLHVVSAALSLPLCTVLSTRALQRRPVWHRWLGRIAGVVVVAGLVPTGVVLSFDAKGGMPVTIGFLLSGAIVLAAMVYGVLAARRGQVRSHAYAMRHVVGQMSVAVTSRALIVLLDLAGVDPDKAYVIALWGPVLGTILLVEAASRPLSFNPLSSFTRIFHHVSQPLAPDPARATARAIARLGR